MGDWCDEAFERMEDGIFSAEDVAAIIEVEANENFPSRRAWARHNGVQASSLCNVVNGKCAPYGKILDALGLKPVLVYVDKRDRRFDGLKMKTRPDVTERFRVARSIAAMKERREALRLPTPHHKGPFP
jgi:lambda repressor-like predicted transcriptional regulator